MNECRICRDETVRKEKVNVLNYSQFLWDREGKNGGEEAEADTSGTDADHSRLCSRMRDQWDK